MKKLLIIVVIILILILTGITIINGLQIGGINILGVKEIKQKNDELNTTIGQATKLASTDYQKKINDLNDAIKKLETEKQSYQDMVSVSTDNQIDVANQISGGYRIDYLWVQIGIHAKSEGVVMKMDVARSSSGAEDVYNLNFTATGGYVNITEFIQDIEDDSKLGFKIEEFRMLASSEGTNTLQATFTCKDIKITGISNNTVTTTPDATTTTNTTTTTTTTNTTNTTTTNTVTQ